MRFISFPFHGLEQLVEYNRNSPTVKRFLPIYANRCTRYPHYESPPAKTRSFPQHCQCTGKRRFQQFIGGSKTWVATSSGNVFSTVRTHLHEKKRKYLRHRLEISIPASSGSVSGSLGETAREAISIRFRQPKGKLYAKNAHQAPRQRQIQMAEGRKWKTRLSNETKFNKNEPS